MIIQRQVPVGIDVTIGRIQEGIEPSLMGLWGKVDVYGRTYLKRTEKEPTVEVYTKNGEYKPLLHSEDNKVFFIQNEEADFIGGGLMRTDLWAVVVLNLEKAKKGFEQRADEAARQDFLLALTKEVGGKRVKSILTGTENLRRISKDMFKHGAFKFTDIHPYHVFMVKMNVDYKYKC